MELDTVNPSYISWFFSKEQASIKLTVRPLTGDEEHRFLTLLDELLSKIFISFRTTDQTEKGDQSAKAFVKVEGKPAMKLVESASRTRHGKRLRRHLLDHLITKIGDILDGLAADGDFAPFDEEMLQLLTLIQCIFFVAPNLNGQGSLSMLLLMKKSFKHYLRLPNELRRTIAKLAQVLKLTHGPTAIKTKKIPKLHHESDAVACFHLFGLKANLSEEEQKEEEDQYFSVALPYLEKLCSKLDKGATRSGEVNLALDIVNTCEAIIKRRKDNFSPQIKKAIASHWLEVVSVNREELEELSRFSLPFALEILNDYIEAGNPHKIIVCLKSLKKIETFSKYNGRNNAPFLHTEEFAKKMINLMIEFPSFGVKRAALSLLFQSKPLLNLLKDKYFLSTILPLLDDNELPTETLAAIWLLIEKLMYYDHLSNEVIEKFTNIAAKTMSVVSKVGIDYHSDGLVVAKLLQGCINVLLYNQNDAPTPIKTIVFDQVSAIMSAALQDPVLGGNRVKELKELSVRSLTKSCISFDKSLLPRELLEYIELIAVKDRIYRDAIMTVTAKCLIPYQLPYSIINMYTNYLAQNIPDVPSSTMNILSLVCLTDQMGAILPFVEFLLKNGEQGKEILRHLFQNLIDESFISKEDFKIANKLFRMLVSGIDKDIANGEDSWAYEKLSCLNDICDKSDFNPREEPDSVPTLIHVLELRRELAQLPTGLEDLFYTPRLQMGIDAEIWNLFSRMFMDGSQVLVPHFDKLFKENGLLHKQYQEMKNNSEEDLDHIFCQEILYSLAGYLQAGFEHEEYMIDLIDLCKEYSGNEARKIVLDVILERKKKKNKTE